MKATRKSIEAFLAEKKMAIAGVSRDPKKFGNNVFRELKGKGFELYPVNPNADEINGEKCYADIYSVPDHVKRLLIVTPKKQTPGLVRDAVSRGIRSIWIQQMSDTPEAVEFALNNNVDLVMKECILMHSEPVMSIHRFHRAVRKFFGLLPK
jgi:uncharacterized protein